MSHRFIFYKLTRIVAYFSKFGYNIVMDNKNVVKIEDILNIQDSEDVKNLEHRVSNFFEEMLLKGIALNPNSFNLSDGKAIEVGQSYLVSAYQIATYVFQVVFKKEMKSDLDAKKFDSFVIHSLNYKKDELLQNGEIAKEMENVLYALAVKNSLMKNDNNEFKSLVENCHSIERLNMEVIKSRNLDAYIYIFEQGKALFNIKYAKEMIISDNKDMFVYAVENGLNTRMEDDELLFYSILHQNYLIANKLVDSGCSVYSKQVLKAKESYEYQKVELYENLKNMKTNKKAKTSSKI